MDAFLRARHQVVLRGAFDMHHPLLAAAFCTWEQGQWLGPLEGAR
jgi:hypothetical protein